MEITLELKLSNHPENLPTYQTYLKNSNGLSNQIKGKFKDLPRKLYVIGHVKHFTFRDNGSTAITLTLADTTKGKLYEKRILEIGQEKFELEFSLEMCGYINITREIMEVRYFEIGRRGEW